MPITTNLNVTPYFDDYDQTKDFYRLLFQPGVSVQTRELNQLQSLFQKQIERFGSNIFAQGTIVTGCNFQYFNPYPYIKIRDVDITGAPTQPSKYLGYNAKNLTTGITAQIVNYADGFETSDPDLKTLYVVYNNANGTTTTFASADQLTVYDPVINGVESVSVSNGGTGFSNTDTVVPVSCLVLAVNNGTLVVGDYLGDGVAANVQIISIDSTTLASANQFIVQVAPRATDLANSSATSNNWTISAGSAIKNPANTMNATVRKALGSGMTATLSTDTLGHVAAVNVIQKGQGYTSAPYVTVRSINNAGGYASLSLTALNYLVKLSVATTSNSVGNGYAFGITEGVIYQKGTLLRVTPQQIVVSKYNQLPDNVAVGFITNETIINSNIDPSLLDNAQGYPNYQAPGADRLKLTPVLTLVNAASSNTNNEFFSVVSWKQGSPYQQNQVTQYSVIGDEMARRTDETSGSFVVDPFLTTTRSPLVSNNEGKYFNVVIDPGTAYINGYRVSTAADFNINARKGTDTQIVNNHGISLNYGNYIQVSNTAGVFQFNTGDTVTFYDTAAGFLSNTVAIQAGTLTPPGNAIGTANIRSMLHYSGRPGTNSAIYNLYLFNISMNPGKNFSNVKSIYYNGTFKGVGDIVPTFDATTNAYSCVLTNPNLDGLLFFSGVDSLKNANNNNYVYRTIDSTVTVSNGNISNATLVKDISASGETYPYSGTLSQTQMQDFYVVPTGGSLVGNNAATGTATVNTTSANITGAGTSWLSNYVVGDWLTITSNTGSTSNLYQIVAMANNTSIQLNANCSFADGGAKLYRTFPQNVPVPFGYRSDLNANVNINQTVITFDFGEPFSFLGTKTAALGVNIQRSNITQLTKTPNRNRFVLLCTSNNAGGTTGPWSLGVPDVFRVSGVYVGNSTVSNTGSNYISNFYVDHNQNIDYYGLSKLYLKPNAPLSLTSNSYILIQFDYFTSSGVGFYDTVSYLQTSDAATIFLQDSQPLSNLASVVNTFEIPEVFSDSGSEYDLIQYFDFRPYATATATPSTVYSTAPLNPANTVTLSTSGEKKFPQPDSIFNTTVEQWLGRTDSVFVDSSGNFSELEGKPAVDFKRRVAPTQPQNTMKIVDMAIPPYPNLPQNLGTNINQIVDTRVANMKYLTTRKTRSTISTPYANTTLPYNQPMVHKQADISNLFRRVSDLEYYVALNTLESNTASMVIPSSVDPALDRFKFGVFVDDFTTSNYSDLTNPQYLAIKEGSDIVPTKMAWDQLLVGYGMGDYIEEPIVQQTVATVGDITDPSGLGPVCALNLVGTIAYKLKFRRADDDLKRGILIDVDNITLASNAVVASTINTILPTVADYVNGFPVLSTSALTQQFINLFNNAPTGSQFGNYTYDVSTQTLTVGINFFGQGHWGYTTITGVSQDIANVFGQVVVGTITPLNLFQYLSVQGIPAGGTYSGQFYLPPVVLYFYNYDIGTKIEIYQGVTLVATTDTSVVGAATPVVLTQTEIDLLTGAGGEYWFNDFTPYYMLNFVDTGLGFVTYAGKITFNYDPTLGQVFTIRTTRVNKNNIRWRWVLAHPIDGDDFGCVAPSPTTTVVSSPQGIVTNYQSTSSGFSGSTLNSGVVRLPDSPSRGVKTPRPATRTVGTDSSADWTIARDNK